MSGPWRSTEAGMLAARRGIKRAYRSARLRAVALPTVGLYANGTLSTESLTLPRFLGIGAPKAGTTWLHHNLAGHPDLYLPDRKELHFFTARLYRGMKWYSSQFEAAADRIPGEITPGYMALDVERIRLIYSLIPDVRLILMVRDPVARAWSHAVMKLARERRRDVGSVSDAEFEAHYRSDFSRTRGDYLTAIDTWTSVFREDQLLVVSYDRITSDPRALLESVMRHIGASTAIAWDRLPMSQIIDRGLQGSNDVFGRTSTPPIPDNHRRVLAQLYEREIAQMAVTYPDLAATWVDG